MGSDDYIFAVFQSLFILFGQICGSFSHKLFSEDFDITRNDKIFSIFGFSGPWFLINSWNENNGMNKYKTLYTKYKIWELMFESFPSVTLQIYVSLVKDNVTMAITVSIIVSVLTISFNVWNYFVGLTAPSSQQQSFELVSGKDTIGDEIEL